MSNKAPWFEIEQITYFEEIANSLRNSQEVLVLDQPCWSLSVLFVGNICICIIFYLDM